jgi:methyltransferase family protein
MSEQNTYIDLLQAIDNQRRANYISSRRTDDILALSQIQTLINGYPFLPITGASLRPICLNQVLNDIVINHRSNIIEFGAGISTVLIGRLIKKNRLRTKLLSIEHDISWAESLDHILKNEQLDDVANVQPAPLTKCPLAIEGNSWYSFEALEKYSDETYDMVIVDGPPAWEKEKSAARYPALPFIFAKLRENFSLYLDDADRDGEQKILQLWERKYNLSFTVKGNALACFYGGNSFFTTPFK